MADNATYSGAMATPGRRPDPGQRWKCGDEFLPFHPQSSIVPPEYRDGWNRCYWMAVARGTTVVPPGLRWQTELLELIESFGTARARGETYNATAMRKAITDHVDALGATKAPHE